MPAKIDRLLDWLCRNEFRLKIWIENSNQNAQQFALDPVGAVRSAGLSLDDDLVSELEAVAFAIQRNNRAVN